MWQINWRDSARRELEKLDRTAQTLILRYLQQRIAASENPKSFGKPLRSKLKGLWRYRVGDYRIICTIEDHRMVVLVVRVGHRRDVYE